MSKSDFGGTHPIPSLCGSCRSLDESFIGTDVGAAQLDLTNQYIPHKYSLERYLKDFRSCVAREFLFGYTWRNSTEAVRLSEVDMNRYLQHVEKNLDVDFSDFKNNEIRTFIPEEGTGQLLVFPARKRVSEGELDPWELSSGRQTTQPRRTRIKTANKQSPKQFKKITSERVVFDHTATRPDAPSSNSIELLPPSILPRQSNPLFLDQRSEFASSFEPSVPIIGELPSTPSLVPHTPDAFNTAQSLLKYPLIIPDTILGLEQKSATAPFASIAQIHKDNARPIFQLRHDHEVHRRTLLRNIPDTVHHENSSPSQSSKSVAGHSSNDSIQPSLLDSVFESPSEWSGASPFTSTSNYGMSDSSKSLETKTEPLSSNRNKKLGFEEGIPAEKSISSAEITFDWDDFINFQDAVDG